MDCIRQMANELSAISPKLQEQSFQLEDNLCSQQQRDGLTSDGSVNCVEWQTSQSDQRNSSAPQKGNVIVPTSNDSERKFIVSKENGTLSGNNNIEEISRPVYDNRTFSLCSGLQEPKEIIYKQVEIDYNSNNSDLVSPSLCCPKNVLTEAPKKHSSESDISDFEDFNSNKRHMSRSIIDIELPSDNEIRETLELLNLNKSLRKDSSSSETVSGSEGESIVTRLKIPSRYNFEPKISDSTKYSELPERIMTRNRFGNSSTTAESIQIVNEIIEKLKRDKLGSNCNSKKLNTDYKVIKNGHKSKRNIESRVAHLLQNSNRIKEKKIVTKDSRSVSKIITNCKMFPKSVKTEAQSKLLFKKKKNRFDTGRSRNKAKRAAAVTLKREETSINTVIAKFGRTRSGRLEMSPSTTRNGTLYERSRKKITPVSHKIRRSTSVRYMKSSKMSSKEIKSFIISSKKTRNIKVHKMETRSATRDSIPTNGAMEMSQKEITGKTSTKSHNTNIRGDKVKNQKRVSSRYQNLLGKKKSSLSAQKRATISFKQTMHLRKIRPVSGSSNIYTINKARTKHNMLLRKKNNVAKRESSRIRNINSKFTTINENVTTLRHKMKTRTPSKTKTY